eukprot:g5149.t1
MNLLRLHGIPILEQLQIEESLYRSDDENWCIVNQYAGPPTVVLGISGKPEKLVHVDRARRDNIRLIKRYSGGGTVVLAPGSFLVSFICRKDCLDGRQAETPDGLMKWSSRFYEDVFRRLKVSGKMESGERAGFELTAQDYTFGGTRKIGGNAQAIAKDRWVHHTSFLWNYDSSIMGYLKIPEKQPTYRSNRDHSDFLLRMQDFVTESDGWWSAVEREVRDRYTVEEKCRKDADVVLRKAAMTKETFHLGAWNVARVTDMVLTFSLATNFSGIGIESWNVFAVEEFTDVFAPPNAMSNCTREAVYTNWSAQNPDFPIGGIYKVPPTGDCTPRCMISDLNELQSHVDEYADNGGEIMSNAACSHNIESWDISSVTEFTSLFSAASPRNFGVLSANLSRWNTSKVESMVDIFKDNTDIQIVGLEKWNTHSLVTLDGAFSGAANFNSDISLWNVRKVSNFRRAFASAREFNADIGSWNVDRAVNMYEMFQHAHAFNADLSCWSTRRVEQFQGMFHDAELFDARGIWVWNVSNGYDFYQMFDLADSVDNCTRFNIYDAWPQHFQFDYTSFGSYTSCAGEPLLLPRSACAPRGCVLTSATIQSEVRNWYELGHTHEECGDVIGSWDVSRVTDLSYIFSRPDFNSDISTWTVDNVTTLQNTFYQAEIFNQNLSAWNVAKVTNMVQTFDFAWVFSGIGIENWNVSAVEDFNSVFTFNINGMTN